mgnify:CR=1 FL=1
MTKKEERVIREIKDRYVGSYFENMNDDYEKGRAEAAVLIYNKLVYPEDEEVESETDED